MMFAMLCMACSLMRAEERRIGCTCVTAYSSDLYSNLKERGGGMGSERDRREGRGGMSEGKEENGRYAGCLTLIVLISCSIFFK